MAERRRFTANFKRQVVEELLSESSTLAQLEPPLRHLLRTYSTLDEALRTRGPGGGPLSAREGTSSAQCGVGADGGQTHHGE